MTCENVRSDEISEEIKFALKKVNKGPKEPHIVHLSGFRGEVENVESYRWTTRDHNSAIEPLAQVY